MEDRMVGKVQKTRATSSELGDLVAEFSGRVRVVPWLVIGLVAGLCVWHGATSAWAIAGVIPVSRAIGVRAARATGACHPRSAFMRSAPRRGGARGFSAMRPHLCGNGKCQIE